MIIFGSHVISCASPIVGKKKSMVRSSFVYQCPFLILCSRVLIFSKAKDILRLGLSSSMFSLTFFTGLVSILSIVTGDVISKNHDSWLLLSEEIILPNTNLTETQSKNGNQDTALKEELTSGNKAVDVANIQETSNPLSPKVPHLPPAYKILLEISDIDNNEQFNVDEEENGGRAKYSLRMKSMNMTCLFGSLASDGYSVEGVKCSLVGDLPQKCFCSKKICRKYVSISSILHFLEIYEASFDKKLLPGKGGVELWTWSVSRDQMTIEAIYVNSRGHPSVSATLPPLYDRLTPISFTIKGPAKSFDLSGGKIWFQYKVSSWSIKTQTKEELMTTPPGVFCPSHERKFIPSLDTQFSLTMETIIENLRTIAYERQSYESEQKLVSFTYNPHLHTEGMFLLNIPDLMELSSETYRVVHNFKTGIQYMINEETKNCTIQAIPLSALDATPTENKQVRLRHASELIFIDPAKFIYKGVRIVRGVLCDVWIAERGVRKGQYSTVEVFFSHENWTVEVEVFNKVRQIPIGVTSYVAGANNPNLWTSIVHTFFYEYSVGHHSWKAFDISPCLRRAHGMSLILTLQVSYNELIHYNLEMVETSIRKAISGVAGVSFLRISDIYLSSQSSMGDVDVWFVLLEKPQISGSVMTPRPEITMVEAFHTLQQITNKNNVSFQLILTPSKKLHVTFRMGSLKTASEALHPNLRKDSHRLLSAGYTAGSVAGLGFSMAILGTCVGIFVGFLLWKRTPNIPYHIRI